MGKGIENFFRILGNGQKHLRAFDEQMYHTTVLYNRLCPEFKPLDRKRLQQKTCLKNMQKIGPKMGKKANKNAQKNVPALFVSAD